MNTTQNGQTMEINAAILQALENLTSAVENQTEVLTAIGNSIDGMASDVNLIDDSITSIRVDLEMIQRSVG
jgi:hypothetical protein